MSESFESGPTVEKLRINLEEKLEVVKNCAAAVAKFESGRPESDLGMSENLQDAESGAREAFESYLKAIKDQGEADGKRGQNEELDFRV